MKFDNCVSMVRLVHKETILGWHTDILITTSDGLHFASRVLNIIPNSAVNLGIEAKNFEERRRKW